MRYALLLILLFCPALALAQAPDGQPQITIEGPQDATIVGQPAIISLKVLVPTYMPTPPVFPSLEQENLLVRLPERASGPISETVNGETWSGVQRRYRVYPMAPGTYDFEAAQILVTFADPETNAPRQLTLPLPPISLVATIPPAARNLDPLIIADEFTLQQDVVGSTPLGVGDAITRSVTATISGTSPIMIPALMPPLQDGSLKAYPKEPSFSETEDRGILSGQRTDRVTYVAQASGRSQLPELAVSWFNLKTGKVETARIDPVDLELTAPQWQMPDRDTLLMAVFALIVSCVFFYLSFKWLAPIIQVRLDEWRHRRNSSPAHAFRELKRAVAAKDLNRVYQSLDEWKRRVPASRTIAEFEAELERIGASNYGRAHAPANWDKLLRLARELKQSGTASHPGLPPLNP